MVVFWLQELLLVGFVGCRWSIEALKLCDLKYLYLLFFLIISLEIFQKITKYSF